MKQSVDFIITKAHIYTVDSSFSLVQSMAVKQGEIVAVGTDKEILAHFQGEVLDYSGKYIYPGFIDPHCHIISYGKMKSNCDLSGSKSWQEVIDRLLAFDKENQSEWLIGRGWDQNDWDVKEFPDRYELDSLFPDKPVYLTRIDGHAALANRTALKMAGIHSDTKIDGGKVALDFTRKGETDWYPAGLSGEATKLQFPFAVPSGILIDNAMEAVKKLIPETKDQKMNYIRRCQEDALSYGLSSLGDAWLELNDFHLFCELDKSGFLKLRVYGMAASDPETKDYFKKNGIYKNGRLHVSSFKYFADGALGSRGAALLEPYTDDPHNHGLLLFSREQLMQEASFCYNNGFQMNTHCIGDSANRMLLEIYANQLRGKNDRRWRIEHCQVINEADFRFFSENSIIPSIQTTHATSDMYWAAERLGSNRMKGAYAYQRLLKECGMVANGSDFPIESINPLLGFYSAVSRQDVNNWPEAGFMPEQALSRKDALRAMTIWAAFSCFEENEKGSLEKGKLADFTVLDQDLMKMALDSIPELRVRETWIGGEKLFERK